MTKKDFELIASILQNIEIYFTGKGCNGEAIEVIQKTAEDFAFVLSEKYPRFQREKFLKACGVEIENRNKTCVNCWSVTKTSLKNWHCANCGVDN